ncbi:MAG TPA: DUF1980 domain-containing protein, partial [Chthoniobacterales bacterium]
MTILFRRFATSGILLVWGVALTFFSVSGRVRDYLHPNFFLPLLICGIALVLLAVGMLVVSAEADCGDPQCCGAITNERIRFRTILAWGLLVIPLLVAVKGSPNQFGASAVWNRGLVVDASALPAAAPSQPYADPPLPGTEAAQPSGAAMDSSTYLVKNERGQIKVEAIDLLFAAQEEGLRPDFENKEVEIIGQFLPAKTNNAR